MTPESKESHIWYALNFEFNYCVRFPASSLRALLFGRVRQSSRERERERERVSGRRSQGG